MRQIQISAQAWLVALWLAVPTEARRGNIFERATTCVATGYTQCAGIQASLPPTFCCPPTSSCLPLAGNTTLLCCPNGNDCSSIQTIPCDISLQNSTQHPDNILKTTALTIPLPQCNGACCPFGFSCDGTNCARNQNQASVPSASTSTSTTIVPTTSAKPGATPTASCTVSHCDKFPVGAVLVGFFPGLLLGILLTIASVCLLGARRRSSDRRRSGSSFGNISEPQPSSDIRTDFLRKPPQTPSSTADSRMTGVQRVRSLFHKPKSPNTPNSGLPATPRPAPPIPLMTQNSQASQVRPVTPVLQREPSYEDINIFADGDTASMLRERANHGNGSSSSLPGKVDDRQTTFGSMMEQSGLAGLSKGQREPHLLMNI